MAWVHKGSTWGLGKWVTAIFITSVLSACGGGGGSSDSSAQETINSPQADFVVPDKGINITTTSNDLVVEKIFQPGVYIFTDKTGNIQKTGSQSFVLRTLPPSFKVGSIFTYGDIPYVVDAITPGTGVSSLGTHYANFDEVLKDLKVHGSVNMDNLDITRMIVDGPDSSQVNSSSPTGKSAVSKTPVTKAITIPGTPFTVKGCTSSTNLAATNSGSYVKCAASYKQPNIKNSGLDITYTGEIGVKDVNFSLLWEKVKKTREIKNVKGSAFFSGDAALSTNKEESVSTLFEDNIPLYRIKIPVPEALGFLRVDFPIYFSYQVPLLKLALGIQADVPFSDSSLDIAKTTVTLKAPVFNFRIPGTFSNEIKDVFVGGKSGPVIVFSAFPSFIPDAVAAFFDGTDYATFDVVGFMGKLGYHGDLKFKINPTDKTQCVDYGIQFAAGVSIDTDAGKLLGAKDTSWFKNLTLFDKGKLARVDECSTPPPSSTGPATTTPGATTTNNGNGGGSPIKRGTYVLDWTSSSYQVKLDDGPPVSGFKVSGTVNCIADCNPDLGSVFTLVCTYEVFDARSGISLGINTTAFPFATIHPGASPPPGENPSNRVQSAGANIILQSCTAIEI